MEPETAAEVEPDAETDWTVEPETAAGPVEPDAERGVDSARFADPAASHDTASSLVRGDGGASRPAVPQGEETAAARTLAQSRRHLEARTDEQLAQTYEETRQAVELAKQQNEGATAEHFSAINRATVQEAARRPDFGAEVHERAARMWLRRGRRSRAFDELDAARRELLEGDGE